MRELHLEYLRERRADYIRRYLRRDIITGRERARMWALFYSRLIRRYN